MSTNYTKISIPLTDSLMDEISDFAAGLGISTEELAVDLIVNSLRINAERNYPSFTVPSCNEQLFINDGFRVIKRSAGYSTLCPYAGLTFEYAANKIAESLNINVTQAEFNNIIA